MLLSPSPSSALANLLRLLAAWLAVIVFMQGVAAAQALGEGPLHHHLEVAALVGLTEPIHDHYHHHDHAERHLHEAGDPTVLRLAADPDAIDGAAFALTAAMALMLLGALLRSRPDTRRHVWRPTAPWAWRHVIPAALLRPPNGG
jgi:hypothetical protein